MRKIRHGPNKSYQETEASRRKQKIIINGRARYLTYIVPRSSTPKKQSFSSDIKHKRPAGGDSSHPSSTHDKKKRDNESFPIPLRKTYTTSKFQLPQSELNDDVNYDDEEDDEMPRASKSYKLKRAEGYINEAENATKLPGQLDENSNKPTGAVPAEGDGNGASMRKNTTHLNHSNKKYKKGKHSNKNKVEEEEYENVGPKRELYLSLPVPNADEEVNGNPSNPKSRIPFSSHIANANNQNQGNSEDEQNSQYPQNYNNSSFTSQSKPTSDLTYDSNSNAIPIPSPAPNSTDYEYPDKGFASNEHYPKQEYFNYTTQSHYSSPPVVSQNQGQEQPESYGHPSHSTNGTAGSNINPPFNASHGPAAPVHGNINPSLDPGCTRIPALPFNASTNNNPLVYNFKVDHSPRSKHFSRTHAHDTNTNPSRYPGEAGTGREAGNYHHNQGQSHHGYYNENERSGHQATSYGNPHPPYHQGNHVHSNPNGSRASYSQNHRHQRQHPQPQTQHPYAYQDHHQSQSHQPNNYKYYHNDLPHGQGQSQSQANPYSYNADYHNSDGRHGKHSDNSGSKYDQGYAYPNTNYNDYSQRNYDSSRKHESSHAKNPAEQSDHHNHQYQGQGQGQGQPHGSYNNGTTSQPYGYNNYNYNNYNHDYNNTLAYYQAPGNASMLPNNDSSDCYDPSSNKKHHSYPTATGFDYNSNEIPQSLKKSTYPSANYKIPEMYHHPYRYPPPSYMAPPTFQTPPPIFHTPPPAFQTPPPAFQAPSPPFQNHSNNPYNYDYSGHSYNRSYALKPATRYLNAPDSSDYYSHNSHAHNSYRGSRY